MVLEDHPSGLEDEGELAYVSAEFWLNDTTNMETPELYAKLLAFQKGWKACKDFYKIST